MVITKMTTIEFDELLKERKDELVQLKEELSLENIEEITKLMRKHYDALPTSRIFTPDKKFTRALSFTSADLSPQGGREKIEIAILGYGRPKDWNQQEREGILEAWEKGPVNQLKLIEEHKVLRIKTREGLKAISADHEYELAKDDNGVPQVIKGRIIEGDEQPIPRDFHTTQGKGENTWTNNHLGYALGERWGVNIHGLTHDGEKDVFIEGSVNSNYDGDWANPKSDDFLFKIAPAFGFYDATIIVDVEKSTNEKLIIKSLSAIAGKQIIITEEVPVVNDDGTTETKKIERPLEFIEYVYGVMEGTELTDEDGNGYIYTPIYDFKAYLSTEDGEMREQMKKGIFMVETKDYPEWHDLYASKDKNGKVKKSQNGSNYCDWSKIGLSVLVCKQVKKTKNGNDQLVLSGSGGKTMNAFMQPENPKIEMDGKWECLVSFNTVRKGTRYDKETKNQIKDAINGDVQINNVMGFQLTFKLMD